MIHALIREANRSEVVHYRLHKRLATDAMSACIHTEELLHISSYNPNKTGAVAHQLVYSPVLPMSMHASPIGPTPVCAAPTPLAQHTSISTAPTSAPGAALWLPHNNCDPESLLCSRMLQAMRKYEYCSNSVSIQSPTVYLNPHQSKPANCFAGPGP